MASALPISVVIVAKNEAHNLPRCLVSVKDWVSETIVLLNDTTDDSATIARQHGAIVHEQPWRGYRDTKNAALALASNNWILSLDADEEVSPALRVSIQTFIARADLNQFAGAKFPRKVWFIDRWITHGDWYPDYSLRLFDRTKACWGGDAHVHEKITPQGPIAKLRGDLHHYSFPTLSSHVAKITPFADLFVKQQIENGGKFSALAAIFRALWRFKRGYIFKLGFLDGFPGLYIATATAFGTFVRYSRLYEHQSSQKPPAPPQHG